MLKLKEGISYNKVKDAFSVRGFRFYEAPYDLNLIGIRASTRDQKKDLFDDLIGCAYTDENGVGKVVLYWGTTDPGDAALRNPSFQEAIKNGTAIVCEGQHRSVFQLGLHGTGSWQHEAFRQTGVFKIYRDKNRNSIMDLSPDTITQGNWYGINLHAAGKSSVVTNIGRYSEGCQVVQRFDEHQNLVRLGRKQIAYGRGDSFTYTLFLEEWF